MSEELNLQGVFEEYKYKNHKEWHEKLQEAPNEKMIKTRSLGGNKVSLYVPITIQEALADVFFKECDIIDSSVEIYTHELGGKPNSQILIKVKIQVLPNYPHSEHRIISGIAAKQIQTKSNSLEYNCPAALSAARSNALTNFANIFGRNLNRDFENNYSYTNKENKK